MKYKIFWNQSAENDLNEILDYIIENGDAYNALQIFNRIRERTELLKSSPEQGRTVTELMNYFGNKYREIIVSPWRIIYTIEKDFIKILIVLDSRRDFEEILFEKLIRTTGG